MSVDHLLIHRCDLKRVVPVDIGNQRFRDDLVAYKTNVACRISSASVGERKSGEQNKSTASHVGYFLPGEDVHRDARVVVDGIVYRCIGRLPPSKPHHLKVLLEELQLTPATVPVTGTAEAI
jgi:hypothetical protein